MSDKLVYSSEYGDLRDSKNKKPLKSNSMPPGVKNDGIVRIQRESKGRAGKFVTCIYGLPYSASKVSLLVKKLKQNFGTGGTVKDGVVIIQGDKVKKIKELLEATGLKVRISGS